MWRSAAAVAHRDTIMMHFIEQQLPAKLPTQTSTNEHFAETIRYISITKQKSQASSNLS